MWSGSWNPGQGDLGLKRHYLLFTFALLWLIPAAAQQAPVAVDAEPHHHVLLKNEFVEVIRATLAPGDSTQFHIHSHDRAGVELTASTTTEQLLGQPEGPPSPSRAGEVYAESVLSGPVTHRVHNVGSTPMDILNVELLRRPTSPSAAVAGPVAAENPSARVYNWVIAPATATAMHTHTRPYLIVAAKPMRLKMTAPDGRSRSEEVKAGDFHWVNVAVTHALGNEGTAEGQIVEIELK